MQPGLRSNGIRVPKPADTGDPLAYPPISGGTADMQESKGTSPSLKDPDRLLIRTLLIRCLKYPTTQPVLLCAGTNLTNTAAEAPPSFYGAKRVKPSKRLYRVVAQV